jgi:hypothetical protein
MCLSTVWKVLRVVIDHAVTVQYNDYSVQYEVAEGTNLRDHRLSSCSLGAV